MDRFLSKAEGQSEETKGAGGKEIRKARDVTLPQTLLRQGGPKKPGASNWNSDAEPTEAPTWLF